MPLHATANAKDLITELNRTAKVLDAEGRETMKAFEARRQSWPRSGSSPGPAGSGIR